MFMFRKNRLPEPERELESISSPFGEIYVDEWVNHMRFRFVDTNLAFFLRAEGDLLRIDFNLSGSANSEKSLKTALWLLTDPKIRQILNPKFGNQPSLRYSAALYSATGHDGRHCILLPTDTVTSASHRFNEVWYKQAPMAHYVGDLARLVKD